MLKRYSLLAMLAVALFALSGCYVSTHSGSNYARVSTARVAYYGPHPVYDVYGSDDWCSVKGVHYHDYAPDSDDFFVRDNGRYVFVGDPTYYVSNVNFDTYYYMGPHPLPVGNNWCYINGPHRHHWAASGYYNYTRVGTVNYYTYYGDRNSYYDPNHRHYDLYTYYSSYQPTRYVGSNRVTVGMSQRPAYNNSYSYSNTNNRPNANSVYVAPSLSGSNANNNYNYNNNYYNNSRPSANVVRPANNSGVVSRPSASTTVVRPASNVNARPSASANVNRPAANTTVVRPATNNNVVTRPANNTTVNRPSANTTVTRPSTTTTTVARPSASTTVTRPSSTTTVNRPSNNTVTRPSASTTVSRPSNTVSRPSSSNTVNRPAAHSNSTNRPSGRVDAPVGKSQYMDNSNEEEEEESSARSRSRSRRGNARRR